MKTLLKTSLALNLGLLGGLIFVLIRANQQHEVLLSDLTTAIKQPETPFRAEPTVATTAPNQPAEPQPFQWSQLAAKDYHAYVKNLRAIGCPEAALRAIVAADVHADYQTQIKVLEEKLSGLDNSSWSMRLANYDSELSIKDKITKLVAAEPATTADLLGVKPAPSTPKQIATANPSATAGGNDNSVPAAGTITMPLVLQNIDPTMLNLNNQQLQLIDRLRQGFVGQVASIANQSLSNPNDQQLWQQAQIEADTQLKIQLGNEVFSRYQQLASQLMPTSN